MRIQDKNKSKFVSNNSTPAPTPPTDTIHECAESGNLAGLEDLLNTNPALLNQKSILMLQTPLHVATSLNKVQIVNYLLQWTGGPAKLELESKNLHGETPLHMAAKNGCSHTAQLLLSHGANVEARTNNLLTPLHLAVGYALRTGDNLIVKTLSDYNANCFAIDSEGLTPVNYIPTGVEDQELLSFLCQNVTEQIQNSTQEIIYDATMARFQSILDQNQADDYGYNFLTSSSFGSSTSNGGNSSSSNSYDIKAKMEEFNDELSKIVGLRELKQQLEKWAKGMLLDEKRRAMGHNLGPRKLPHMAFLGNPGTGKTTVARILGKLLKSVGVLTSDKVIEVQRTDLVGEYLGQTGPKTRKKIEEAMGGILFVDEAYQLAPRGSSTGVDYGVEAMEEIMSVLEEGELVVVFAGYTEKMKRVFSSNQGLCRRVTHFFEFEDYTCRDLAEMLMIKMRKQSDKSRLYGFKLDDDAGEEAVLRVIEQGSSEKLRRKMNGGLVDLMLNNARENLDSRVTLEDDDEQKLLTITLPDLEAGLRLVMLTAAAHVNIDDDDDDSQ